MKIKNDFVSNSSSTCFIVQGLTTTMVAISLLGYLKEYEEEYESNCVKAIEKAIDHLKTSSKSYDRIFFPWGINYDTLIQKGEGSQVLVHTCNNHNWLYAFPPEVDVRYIGEDEDNHEYPWGQILEVFDCKTLEEVEMKIE